MLSFLLESLSRTHRGLISRTHHRTHRGGLISLPIERESFVPIRGLIYRLDARANLSHVLDPRTYTSLALHDIEHLGPILMLDLQCT